MFAAPRLDRLGLVPWAEIFRFDLFLHLSSFFLLHSIFTTGLFALLPLTPLLDWPGVCADCGEEEMKDAERHIRDGGKRSLTTLTTLADENRELGLPHHPSDFTLMANSFLTRTVEVFYTFAVQ